MGCHVKQTGVENTSKGRGPYFETERACLNFQHEDCGYRRGNIFFSDREHLNMPIINYHYPSLIYLSGKITHVSLFGAFSAKYLFFLATTECRDCIQVGPGVEISQHKQHDN